MRKILMMTNLRVLTTIQIIQLKQILKFLIKLSQNSLIRNWVI